MTKSNRVSGEALAYPVLPLKTTVVFPRTVATLHVSRKQTIELINQSQKTSDEIVLALASGTDDREVRFRDFHQIGVLARIVKVQESHRDSLIVTFAAEKRVRLTRFVTEEPYCTAYVEDIHEEIGNPNEQLALTERIASLVERLIKKDDRYSSEHNNLFDLSRDVPGSYCDTIANQLYIPVEKKQKVLDAISVTERAGVLLGIITEELQKLTIESELDSKVRISIDKTQREEFLRKQLAEIRRELGDTDPEDSLINEYRERVRALPDLPEHVVNRANLEIDRLKMLSPASSEYGSTKGYLDFLLNLPWNRFSPEETRLAKIERDIKTEYYGHESIKEEILEYLAVRKLTADIRSPVLCLAGPPGTGKTSLAETIACALNREFVNINVAGLTSVDEIRGSNRSFVGSKPGRIMRAFAGIDSCNPVILLDDLDKLSEHRVGYSLPLLFVEIIDPRQNKFFVDEYLGLHFDLSHAIFIATVDTLDTIPDALSERMEVVEFPGYIEDEKVAVAQDFLVPKLMKRYRLSQSDLRFTAGALRKIVRNYTLESGIFNFKRELEVICRKCVRQKAKSGRVSWRVTERNLERFLGTPLFIPEVAELEPEIGVVTGLAWTESGGELMMVEGLKMQGVGNVITTGSLGEVMQESIQAAHSYVRSKAEVLGIDHADFDNYDVHIHFPSGSIPKDGPSAGLAVCMAIASVMSNCPIRNDVAMTGEVSLRGKVLPVSGSREKIAAAHRAGIYKVILPRANEKDIRSLPDQLTKDMDFTFVEDVEEVFEHTLMNFDPEVLNLQQIVESEISKAAKNIQRKGQLSSRAGAGRRRRSASKKK